MISPSKLIPYVDGWFGPERELTVVPRPIFPFLRAIVPDVFTRLFERDYQVLPRLFVPKIANRTAWTNLLTYSEAIDNAAWTKSGLTATADAIAAPSGAVTMDKLLETATNAEHYFTQAATVTAAPTEFSIFVKGGLTRDWIRLGFTDSAASFKHAYFDLSTGRVGGVASGVTAVMTALGGGYFRCAFTVTPAAGAGTLRCNLAIAGSASAYLGVVTNGMYFWGAQVTTSAGPTPYVSTTTAARTISAPDLDPDDPLAFLVAEADPVPQTSEAELVRRTFSRIPKQQIEPGSMFITKPAIQTGERSGLLVDYTAYPDNGVTGDAFDYGGMTYASGIFYSKLSAAATQAYAAGGTFTLTYKASTTAAIAYNASNATIAAALNALASVIADGLTFAVDIALWNLAPAIPRMGFTITTGSTTSLVTMNAASLTPAPASKAFTYWINTTGQLIYVAQRAVVTAHGFSGADPLVVFQAHPSVPTLSSYRLLPTTSWAVIDANTIAFLPTQQEAPLASTYGQEAGTYSPGTVLTRTQRVTDFYLLGVTPGVDTLDQVPLPTYEGSDASLVSAILQGATTLNYEVGDLSAWRDTVILARTTVTINPSAL